MKGTPLNDQMVDYILDLFPVEDELLQQLRAEAESAEIPPIQISPEQGAFIKVFLKAINAVNVLEIGTLGGYSAIVMGRALPEHGKVTTIEIDPLRAEFARKHIEKAGLEHKIDVLVGSGIDLLERTLSDSGPYDFAFIDADKHNYVRYAELLLPLIRNGGIIAGDNALAWGQVHDGDTDDIDIRGIQQFNRFMSAHPNIDAALVPTGDGMCIGVVNR